MKVRRASTAPVAGVVRAGSIYFSGVVYLLLGRAVETLIALRATSLRYIPERHEVVLRVGELREESGGSTTFVGRVSPLSSLRGLAVVVEGPGTLGTHPIARGEIPALSIENRYRTSWYALVLIDGLRTVFGYGTGDLSRLVVV
jgi:hypothetical protein